MLGTSSSHIPASASDGKCRTVRMDPDRSRGSTQTVGGAGVGLPPGEATIAMAGGLMGMGGL